MLPTSLSWFISHTLSTRLKPAPLPLPSIPTLLRLQVAGQYILKQGDEVAFVLHTNLKSGELNGQRVRRTKEAPEPPPAPGERSQKAAGLCSVNPRMAPALHRFASSPRDAEPMVQGSPQLPGLGPFAAAWHSTVAHGPPLPPLWPAEPAPRPAPVPAVNPNKNKYSGNLASGTYKQPKIAKGPGARLGVAGGLARSWAAAAALMEGDVG